MLALNKQLRRAFGVRQEPELTIDLQNGLSEFHYRSGDQLTRLFGAGVFLSVAAAEQYRNGNPLFPKRCCVCGGNEYSPLPIYSSCFWRIGRLFSQSPVIGIPHCAEHSKHSYASFVFQVFSPRTKYIKFYCMGRNREYLEELKRINSTGDLYPPWEAFPGCDASLMSWKQGTNEAWFHEFWKPFWTALDRSAKSRYLNRWCASESWRDFLLQM